MASKQTGTIVVPEPDIISLKVHIIGTSSLICHRFSEKAKKMIADKQGKKAKQPREVRDPEAEYKASLYTTEDGFYGFPSIAFKAAVVRAGTYADMHMTFLRGAFHVGEELVLIDGAPQMRTDMVRLNGKSTDFRYRGEFKKWSAAVPVTLNASVLSVEQLVNLFTGAGFAVGVGEWRPERNGQHGRFIVDTVEIVE